MTSRDGFASRSFCGADGSTEHYITVEAPPELDLAGQLDMLGRAYADAAAALRLPADSAIFRRLYLSDAANQAAAVRASDLFGEPAAAPPAVSIVQQPPLPGAKVAMLAYHLEGDAPVVKRPLAPGHLLVEKNGLGHLWSTGLCAGATAAPSPTAAQTDHVFARLTDVLAGNGATLADHCVRTWIYVRDVDVFYQEMVDSRTRLFARQGLTRDTHYLASTGIQGACAHRYDTVLMDAYSVLGLDPRQVSYLNDFDRLCATKDYNVTFERGTRIGYADRAHCFISGTASIDPAGQVVHPGDVLAQLGRALDNVAALLRAGGARLADLIHLIVYLRDPSDFPPVDAYLRERFADLPLLILQGAVCRPDWLIEVEGIAVAVNADPTLPRF